MGEAKGIAQRTTSGWKKGEVANKWGGARNTVGVKEGKEGEFSN